MKNLIELLPTVQSKIESPVLIVLGAPWPVTQVVAALAGQRVTCFQMDFFQAQRLREKLAQENIEAEVVVHGDLWDVEGTFKTILFPAAAHADRELKLDIVEQGFHLLEQGGKFITLSEYERDDVFLKLHKKVFGKCSEAPRSEFGSCFWSTREGDQPRRRHEMTFRAKINDGPSQQFASWPGTFSYGEMDAGSRAMLEVADIRPGDKVLDLGCGNGSVGCLASVPAGPNGSVLFVDSNARALKLTELNANANGVKNFKLLLSADLLDIPVGAFDVVLANPPYYANSEVGRMFIATSREVLRPGGRFYFVTKMPVRTIPDIVDMFGQVDSVENRGYTVVIATA